MDDEDDPIDVSSMLETSMTINERGIQNITSTSSKVGEKRKAINDRRKPRKKYRSWLAVKNGGIPASSTSAEKNVLDEEVSPSANCSDGKILEWIKVNMNKNNIYYGIKFK